MKQKQYFTAGVVLLLVLSTALIAGVYAQEDEPTPTSPCPEAYQEAWSASGHADADAEAFTHWDEDDPPEVPVRCAKCHSEPGYLDFLGENGTEAGTVDNPAPTGTVVTCTVCHNETAAEMSSVVFPSSVEVTGLGPAARCMQCHQGRASRESVTNAIAEVGLEDMDTPSEELGFVNIHYFAAAATLFGSEVHGGFEYEDESYQMKFAHVENYDTCNECHNVHTLEVKLDECTMCHTDVEAIEDIHNIRMQGSLVDYDGDGDIEEGIYHELEGLRELLYQAMQAYASEVVGTPIGYNAQSYPYFFIDTNENGTIDEDEAQFPNQYNAFTGRLLKAAYNYQLSIKDPGAFAHNAKYVVELLYDSIEDLNTQLSEPVDLSQVQRDDPGHFDATSEAFRHFDEDGEVSASCAKCHSAEGLPFFLEHGVTISFPPANSLACTTCHANLEDFALHEVVEVFFPSGTNLIFGEGQPSNLCLNCHQGRASTLSVDSAIEQASVEADEVSEELQFQNPHYFAAGATLFGAAAQGAYQYEGKEYQGQLVHIDGYNTCVQCHSTHQLTVRVDECSQCHTDVESMEDLHNLRFAMGDAVDYDGDGDTEEGVAGEIETIHEVLLQAIQEYAANTTGTPIVYESHTYPYWFTDTNENGEPDPDEANFGNRYANWTPSLVRATYNYQFIEKDPGGFAHNNEYILQILYDSLEAIGGEQAVENMTRPAVVE